MLAGRLPCKQPEFRVPPGVQVGLTVDGCLDDWKLKLPLQVSIEFAPYSYPSIVALYGCTFYEWTLRTEFK